MKRAKRHIRKLKFLEILAFILYVLFIAALPVGYAMIRTTTGELTFNFVIKWSTETHNVVEKVTSLSFTFLLTIAMAALHFTGALKKFHEKAQFGFFKMFVIFLSGAILPTILFSIAWYIKSWANGSEAFIINGLFIFIAKSIIRPWQDWLSHNLGREIRKQEMREVLREEN